MPCIIRWKSDTLVAVFQWFRQPSGSATWDRVAVKFSYNDGTTWTDPQPIVMNNFPQNYQRPFDPTLVVLPDKSLRIFYSSSDGMPSGGLTPIVNTYSAISIDGIHYDFETGARFDHPTNRVIDPAVTVINGTWHYYSPIGAPQDGAYHCTSADGLNFTQTGNISSDNTHNWTGNLLVDGGQLKFYGSGPFIWNATSSDGAIWNGYVNTNIQGGDPGIVKLQNGQYMMVYVGQRVVTGLNSVPNTLQITASPNPFAEFVFLKGNQNEVYRYTFTDARGATVLTGKFTGSTRLNMTKFPSGNYFIKVENSKGRFTTKLIK
ncbi:MAG: T9SS type A sorting domain-containing protein [Chitinophagaceae bacterium]|nr:T9SS type A sorting domain-containing protein [Chitinophagaceae bacterium]